MNEKITDGPFERYYDNGIVYKKGIYKNSRIKLNKVILHKHVKIIYFFFFSNIDFISKYGVIKAKINMKSIIKSLFTPH